MRWILLHLIILGAFIRKMTLLDWIGLVGLYLLLKVREQLRFCWELLWEIRSSLREVADLMGQGSVRAAEKKSPE
jgi:hypothetical protein